MIFGLIIQPNNIAVFTAIATEDAAEKHCG